MKVSEIKTNDLDNELIKTLFFNVKKEKYDYADYLIIYGCHIKELLDERLNHAIDIIKNKKVSKIVLTGGVGLNGDFNESEYMRNFLIEQGIDINNILIDDKSTTTEENNINICNILNLQNIDKTLNIVLVTNELHVLRLMLHWKKILSNSNINFYYDYVENSLVSYNNVISNPELIELLKKQLEKIKRFIDLGIYEDIDLSERDDDRKYDKI